MAEISTIPLQEFMTNYISPLKRGAEAFHGQLFPGPYPPDQRAHSLLKACLSLPENLHAEIASYSAFLAEQKNRGVSMRRLRLLPDRLTKDVDAMVALARKVAGENGEDWERVRVARIDTALGAMALHDDIPPGFSEELRQKTPRGGLWVVHQRTQAAEPEAPPVVGIMDYNDQGELPGIAVYQDPPAVIKAYADFWRSVFNSVALSVPLNEWDQLYS